MIGGVKNPSVGSKSDFLKGESNESNHNHSSAAGSYRLYAVWDGQVLWCSVTRRHDRSQVSALQVNLDGVAWRTRG